MKFLRTAAMGFAAFFLAGASAKAQTFTAIEFYTSSGAGGTGSGISGGKEVGSSDGPDADLWNGSPTTPINLNPSGWYTSQALGLGGNQQVGEGGQSYGAPVQALLWTGSASSYVNLTPSGYSQAAAYATSGTQQVGMAQSESDNNNHAMLWSGTAATAIQLPDGADGTSAAYGIGGNQVVGEMYGITPGYASFPVPHAALWTITVNNGVTTAVAADLHPSSAFGSSFINGTSGTHQVGYATTVSGDYDHAIIWSGTASSYFDLTPNGYQQAVATAISGNETVGWGELPNSVGYTAPDQALLWEGTGSSSIVVDLNSYFPAGFLGLGNTSQISAQANAIDANGDVFGTADGEPVEWEVTPEPSSLSIIGIVAGGLFLKRRRSCRASRLRAAPEIVQQ